MNTEKRREILMKRLREAEQPLTGMKLARELGVSRQIIVGDIALLRDGGKVTLLSHRDKDIDLLNTHYCIIRNNQMQTNVFISGRGFPIV